MKPIDFLKDERALAEIEKHKWFESEKAGHDIGFEAAAADWIKRFGLKVGWRNLLSRFENRIRIYPEVQKVLKELEQRGFRLIIITNASTEFLEFQLASTNIGDCFEAVFSATSDFGLVKKTVDLYRRVCGVLEIFPNEMIHVGDDRNFDFDVPRRLGILAFHLDRAGTHKGEFVIHDLEDLNKKLARAK